jgi:hypothetical protein
MNEMLCGLSKMLQDSTIRKSLDEYIKTRIKEISMEMNQTFPDVRKVWKCENQLDFLYGYYVGKIEEGAFRYLLKATRASAGGYVDTFDIRGVIETHRNELLVAVKKSLEQ